MYAVAIAAVVLSVLCLETVFMITRRWGEKPLTLTVSPVSGEQLSGLLGTVKQVGANVESFTLADGKAVITMRVRLHSYEAVVSDLLSATAGYQVEIS